VCFENVREYKKLRKDTNTTDDQLCLKTLLTVVLYTLSQLWGSGIGQICDVITKGIVLLEIIRGFKITTGSHTDEQRQICGLVLDRYVNTLISGVKVDDQSLCLGSQGM
jgi:hypothetical protein